MTTPKDLEFVETTIQKTHEWLREFMQHTGRDDGAKAWQSMRAVLHILRDRLTVAEAAHLSAQLPMLLRGLYYEGWKPASDDTPPRSRDDFVQAVADQLSGHPEIDPNQAIEGTFHVLNAKITDGEIEDIKNMLPSELQTLWPSN